MMEPQAHAWHPFTQNVLTLLTSDAADSSKIIRHGKELFPYLRLHAPESSNTPYGAGREKF